MTLNIYINKTFPSTLHDPHSFGRYPAMKLPLSHGDRPQYTPAKLGFSTKMPLEQTSRWGISIKLKNFVYHHFLARGIKNMDFRIALVLAPLAIAASWAIFNIGAAALGQLKNMQTKE